MRCGKLKKIDGFCKFSVSVSKVSVTSHASVAAEFEKKETCGMKKFEKKTYFWLRNVENILMALEIKKKKKRESGRYAGRLIIILIGFEKKKENDAKNMKINESRLPVDRSQKTPIALMRLFLKNDLE